MIRVLIVDDEYLTRKGLIQTLPWEKYGMQVIGEADSVQSALEMLNRIQADLVFTDITMPNDSGLKLIETIHQDYENIYTVVITCHRDFGMIQSALRLGAIDYMVKTELGEVTLDESFARIQKRILAEQNNKMQVVENSLSDKNYVFLFVAKGKKSNNEIISIKCFEDSVPVKVENNVLLYFVKQIEAASIFKKICQEKLFDSWNVIGISNVGKVRRDILNQFVYEYISTGLFYRNRENRFEEFDIKTYNHYKMENTEQIERLRDNWANLMWVFDPEMFDRICNETITLKPQKEVLKQMLYEAMTEWSDCLELDISQKQFQMLKECNFWFEYKDFAKRLGADIAAQIHVTKYPIDTVVQILKAINYVKDNYDTEITQSEIADIFSISRSYFSKVFKDIFGVQYVIFIRNYKLQKAKLFLRNTDYSLGQIADKVGFQDERYFGKIFKEKFGITPMEYRKDNVS